MWVIIFKVVIDMIHNGIDIVKIDRFDITKEIIKKLPNLGNKGSHITQIMNNKLIKHKHYIKEYGIDMDEIRNWEWKK